MAMGGHRIVKRKPLAMPMPISLLPVTMALVVNARVHAPAVHSYNLSIASARPIGQSDRQK